MRKTKLMFVSAAIMIAVAANSRATEHAPAAKKTDKQIIVEGNNKFALELYAKLRGGGANLFLSPYSISTALAMTYAGARGETGSQMAKVLHFPTIVSSATEPSATPATNRRQFASAFGKIVKDLNARGEKGGYELRVANALWGQKQYGFLEEFLELIKTNYGGQLNEVDFAGAAEVARKTINTWVEKKTNNKIKNLIPKGVLDSMTRLVLTNAIYFKGNWARQFKEEMTEDAPFTLTDGEKIDAAMMNQTAEFGYAETDTFQGLELPYVDNELSMIILLPKKSDGLSNLEKALTLKDLSGWLAKLRKQKVIVSVPRFKMTSRFSLASVLKSMGMTNAFSAKADFSGMNGRRDLFISAVIHKAYVDVNEEGTEAAAATAVTVRLTSIAPTQMPVFRADHPFLFLIRDNQSDSILFIGRVMNPNA
ncbi:MAG: serpin family protein [Planctomycetes bacterium B3_Pla]|nr:MAG: serpin family protein [Planctomycetes bacterium B3_Pla]